MDSQHQHDFQRRLQELEAEVQQTSTQAESRQTPPSGRSLSPVLQQLWLQVMTWFSGLPTVGKAVVAIVAVILGLSLLNTVLSLVTTAITLAIVVAVLYGLYRVFLASRTVK